MSITVSIGGVSRSPLVRSLSLTLGLQAQATCEMEFIAQDGWIPDVGAAVEVRSSGTLIYLGSVESVPRQVIVDSKLRISVSCVDITQITGRRVCGMRTWVGKNAGQIFNEIIAGDLSGEDISTTFVSDSTGPVIPTFETKYETVNDRLNTLAETAGMVWRLTWDREARLHLATAFDAGFQVDDATALVQNLKIEGDRSNYANRVIVTLPQGTVPGKMDTYTSAGRVGDVNDPGQAVDGVQYVFQTSSRMVDTPVITWTGYPMTVGEEGIDTGKDCYWTRGSTEWRVDSAIHVAPFSTDTMVVTYTAITETQIVAQNDAEVSTRAAAEGGTGVYAIHKDIADEISLTDAQAYADNLVAALSQISYTATFETDTHMNPLCAGTEPGQRIWINRTGYGIGGWFLIRRVTISDHTLRQGTYLKYRIESSNGPGMGDALTWFRQLIGQGGPSIGLSAGGVAAPPDPGVPGAATPPTQPTLANWSVGAVTISADANKNYFVGITLNETTALPGDSELMEFWFYRGSGSGVPADPGLWQWCGNLTAAGSTTFYDPHPGSATTWKVCATASRGDYRVYPSLSTPTRDIAISSIGLATAISGATATLQTQTNDGVKQFRYEFAFTAPSTSDQNYRLTVLESAWVDVTTGAWVAGVSKWERVLDIACYGTTLAYLGNDPRWIDCIRPGVTAGRRRWRIRSVNWNDAPSLASQPADISDSILTDVEPYSDGFDGALIKAATVKNIPLIAAASSSPAGLAITYPLWVTGADQNGNTQWYPKITWTPEVATRSRAVLQFELKWGGVVAVDLGMTSIAMGEFFGAFQPWRKVTGTEAILCYVLTSDGVRTLAATLPITIPAGPVGVLELGNAKPGTSTITGDLTLNRGADSGQLDLTSTGFQASKTTAGVTNKVLVDGAGITISQGVSGGSLLANAAGIIIAKTTSGVTAKTEVNSTGVQISHGSTGGVTTVDSTGVTISQGTYSVKASAAGVTIKQVAGGTMTLDSTGIVIQKGSSSVTVAAAGVTIVNGILNSPTITVNGTLFTTTISATDGFKAVFTGGAYSGQTVQILANGITVAKSSWQGLRLSAPTSGNGGRVELVLDDMTSPLIITADGASNRITSARPGSYVALTGLDSYVEAYSGFKVGGLWVVGSRKAAIAAPTGGSVIDIDARRAINDIINRLGPGGHGLTS